MCLLDTDCSGPLGCYVNVSWSDSNFCGCHHGFGGYGTNCTELSIQSYINITSFCIMIVICVVSFAKALFLDVRVAFLKDRLFNWDELVSFVELIASGV